MSKILVSGLATLDCLYSVASFSAEAQKFVASGQQWAVGGGAANAALCCHRLGAEAVLLSRLGDDLTGQLIQSRLRQEGVDCSDLLLVEGASSATSSILLDPAGERQIINFRGDFATRDSQQAHSLAESLAHRRFDAVLSDNRWLQGNKAALQVANAQGIPGVLDAEPPFSAELVALATHVAFSREGLQEYTATDDLEHALQQAHERLDSWVCVTDGERGVLAIEQGKVKRFAAFSVVAIDTLGAGDVWHGAFCQQLAAGQTEAQSILFASATAALKCRHKGGGSVTPTMREVEELLRQAG